MTTEDVRSREEIESMINAIDYLLPETQSIDPIVAACYRMSADLLRWTINEPPRHGAKTIVMLQMVAKAKAALPGKLR